MIPYLKFTLLILVLTGCKKKDEIITKLNPKDTYLIFRNSETKEGFFVKSFNLYETNVTHVGFLIRKREGWKIYHALDVRNENCIKVNTLSEFCADLKSSKQYKIVELVNFNQSEELISILDSVRNRKPSFDFTFSKKDSNSTYCSKLICEVLQCLEPKRFRFKMFKRKLNNIESAYLKKDTLEYYPVDLFFRNSNFKAIN